MIENEVTVELVQAMLRKWVFQKFPATTGEVDDLVQEAWVVLVRRNVLEVAASKRNPWAYIKTVALRACIDVIKAKQTQKRGRGYSHVSWEAACLADATLREIYS